VTSVMVTAQQVRKSYGHQEVLKGVDLEIRSGEVVCMLGKSGSGKSTFLRCVNRLETIDDGVIVVDGEIIGFREKDGALVELSGKEIARQRAMMGMVFQQFNLFENKTALQNVMEGPVVVRRLSRAAARERALELLELVGLADRATYYPSQLSGGQQQRVAIARALAMDPKVLLFDEPTSALDPELVGEVLQVMRQLAQAGMTMVVVTHEINFARDVADKVVFMSDGEVAESGAPDEVLTRPSTAAFRTFLKNVNRMDH
jgi:polar amino acid transport system ATP-binding protein